MFFAWFDLKSTLFEPVLISSPEVFSLKMIFDFLCSGHSDCEFFLLTSTRVDLSVNAAIYDPKAYLVC